MRLIIGVIVALVIGTIASSLILNRFLEKQYLDASAASERYSRFQADLAGLLPRVGAIAEAANVAAENPGRDLSTARIDAALDEMRLGLAALAQRVPVAFAGERHVEVGASFAALDTAFRRLAVQVVQLKSYLRNAERDAAAAALAAVNRQAQTISIAISQSQAKVAALQTARLNAQAQTAKRLRYAELVLTGTAAAVILLVLLYMRRLSVVWAEARAAHARAREESRISAERFERAARGTHDGIWDWEAATDKAFFSERLHELLGLAPGALQSVQDFSRLAHPEDAARAREVRVAHLRGHAELHLEHRLRCGDGEYRWFLLRGEAQRDAAGQVERVSGSLTDISARKATELRLEQSAAQVAAERARLAAFVEHAPAAIAMFDAGLRVVCASRRWLEAFADTTQPVTGRPVFEVARGAPASWRTALSRVLDGEIVRVDDEPWQARPDAAVNHLRWEARPWRDETGASSGVLLSVQDISADHARAAELAAMRDAAEAANRAKSEFLATMSHEIRTPMNGVLGFTQLLLDTSLDHEQRDYVQTIESSGQALLALINDILDYSKIEAGKLTVEKFDFDLDPIVEEVASLFAPQVSNKGVDLLVDLGGEAHRRVNGDPTRLRQVLLNLLGNSLKFTERGHILLEIAREPAGLVRISVTDTGIGMNEQVQRGLFRKFVQGDSTTTRRFGGTGLGLAICKQLVEMMGGEIGVESTPGVGSKFWFTVPLSPEQIARADSVHETLHALRGLRVLVVDDVEPNRRIVTTHLTRWGMHHESVENGRAALDSLRSAHARGTPFDLAVVDYLMPEMDGETLCRELRAEARFHDLALVMLTSSAQRGEAARMLEAGFDVYLTKPLTRASRLLDAVADARSRRAARVAESVLATSPVPAHGQAPAAATSAAPVGTVEAHRPARAAPADQAASVLVVDDNATNRMLAQRILAKLGVACRLASDGAEALAALQEAPPVLVLMDCHMPVMDGFEATAAIRAHEASLGRRTPIVALSAGAMSEERDRCLAADMDGFLAKPLAPSELVAELDRWNIAHAPVPQQKRASA